MARTVKTDPASHALALLTRSARFESQSAPHPLETIEVHAIMNELASITSQSLAPLVPKAPVAPVAAAAFKVPETATFTPPPIEASPAYESPAFTPIPTPTPASAYLRAPAPGKPEFSTRNQQYKPALGDEYLVEALLRYHGDKQSRSARGGSRGVIKSDAEIPPPEPMFEPASFPQVDASPKNVPIQPNRSAAIRQPILRAPRRPQD